MQKLVKTVLGLQNNSVGEAVRKRMLEFKEIRTKGNKEWFLELCFCLLTANTSAKMGLRMQQALSYNDLAFLPKQQLVKKMNKLRCRFYNRRAEFIVKARKYLNLKDIVISFENERKARLWLAQNVKGIGLKEASLPFYEKIIVIIGEKIKFVEIGNFVEDFKREKFRRKKLSTFSFNPKTLKIEIAPITNVFSHDYKNDLFEIYLKTGRKIHVTGDHSVFTIKSGEIIPVEVRNLKKNDFLAIPSYLPTISSLEKEMNLVKEFLNENIAGAYVHSKSYCTYLRKKFKKLLKRKNQYTQHFRGIMHFETLKKLPKTCCSSEILKKHKVRIGFRRSPNEIKSVVTISNDVFWLLGLIIAEGYVGKNPIEIHQGSDEYGRILKCRRIIKKIFGNEIGIKIYKRKNHIILKIYNLAFFYFIKNLCKITGTATKKSVPEMVFSGSINQIKSFLQGFWEGDGWKKSDSYMSMSTASKNLANDLMVLFLMIGAVCRNCMKRRNYTIDLNGVISPVQIDKRVSRNKYDVIPDVGRLLHLIHRKLNLRAKIRGKHTKLYKKIIYLKSTNENPSRIRLKKIIKKLETHGKCKELSNLKKIIESDIEFLSIKNIRKISYGEKKVYDLEVATKDNHQNFVGGFGGIFLHNSHFLRNVGFENTAILDKHVLNVLAEHKLIEKPKILSPKKYFEIEQKLKVLCRKTNAVQGELDLYLWYLKTGKVLK